MPIRLLATVAVIYGTCLLRNLALIDNPTTLLVIVVVFLLGVGPGRLLKLVVGALLIVKSLGD